jgi:hypothetical protein
MIKWLLMLADQVWRSRLEVEKWRDFLMRNFVFLYRKLDFLMRKLNFLYRKLDFLMRNLDFLYRKLIFLMRDLDFLMRKMRFGYMRMSFHEGIMDLGLKAGIETVRIIFIFLATIIKFILYPKSKIRGKRIQENQRSYAIIKTYK